MKTKINKITTAVLAALLVVFPGTASIADDTEVYLGSPSLVNTVRPNVLFIIDTSGSMDWNVTIEGSPWDPDATYDGDCNADYIYWSSNGNEPDCSTNRYFVSTANQCSASFDALGAGGSGRYVGDRLAQYQQRTSPGGGSADQWRSLSNSVHDAPIECRTDNGTHGDGSSDTLVYPAQEANGGPWVADSADAIDWSGTGDTYTLFTGNYLNWFHGAGADTVQKKLDVVKDTFAGVLNSTTGINIGLMRFSDNGSGGYFLEPMQELNADNRASFIETVNGLTADGNTPLSETLYEASLYFRAQAVDYGDSSSPGTNVAGVLDADDDTKYATPMEYQCQKNFIVLLTDGEPVGDTEADDSIEAMPGFTAATGSSTCAGNCLDEVAQYMYKKDLNDDLHGVQNVSTFTIGFQTDQTLLNATAEKSKGRYYTADSVTDLASAFNSIVMEILSVSDTFIAPAVAVNAFNRLTHRDELFFAVFHPEGSARWPGNVKHYKLAGDPPIVVDANDAPAVDANTGFFSLNSRSFWTLAGDAPDGDDVEKGGAAGVLSTSRNLYTYTGAAAPSNVALTADAHAFHEDNDALTVELLGVPSATADERTQLIQWGRGIDVLDDDLDGSTTDARRAMGDPLHAKPVLMTYGGTDDDPDITLFLSTNEGILHAIDTSDGTEQFGFVPKELLGLFDTRFTDSTADPHQYGLDGSLSLWHNDANGNGVVLDADGNVETDEHVYLYVGMRRGGRDYYALDVTDRDTPVLKWRLVGGEGDFTELGQSWSRPSIAKIRLWDGSSLVDRKVLIFGGGYDSDQDDADSPQADDVGRAIYIVDANTGQRLWWASSDENADLVLAGMTNSIPSDVRVIDINTDGYADQLFVGDMGGRIWRIDIDNVTNTGAANLATGGVFADIGGDDQANNRRFYYPPDVAYVRDGAEQFLTVSIGSGYRAHPTDQNIEDRFYMIRDENVFYPPPDTDDPADGAPNYPAYTEANLYDATANDLGEATGDELATAQALFNSRQGWYIRLVGSENTTIGEKVLASSLTAENQLIFTTFTPVANDQASACAPSQGTAKTYVVNLLDAKPTVNFDPDGDPSALTDGDRFMTLARGGVPPEPTVIFPPDGGDPVLLIGPEKLDDVDLNVKLERAYWLQEY